MQLGEMSPPYWPDPNGKVCVKNHTVTVSLNILQIWYWELRLEGPGVPDRTHMNELNQIDLCIPNHMQNKNSASYLSSF